MFSFESCSSFGRGNCGRQDDWTVCKEGREREREKKQLVMRNNVESEI